MLWLLTRRPGPEHTAGYSWWSHCRCWRSLQLWPAAIWFPVKAHHRPVLISIKYFWENIVVQPLIATRGSHTLHLILKISRLQLVHEGSLRKGACERNVSQGTLFIVLIAVLENKQDKMWESHRQSRHEDLHVQLGETTWNTKHMHVSKESENTQKTISNKVKSLKSRRAQRVLPCQDFEAASVSKKVWWKVQNDSWEMKMRGCRGKWKRDKTKKK